KCAQCGASYIVADRYRYACASYLNRGESVCRNHRRVARRLLEETLLRGIQENLFTQEGFAFFRQEIRRVLDERRKARQTEAGQIQVDLHRVEIEIQNLLKAIKTGIWTPTTKAELERLEEERARLVAKQQTKLDASSVEGLLPRLEERFQ